jgi:hypothetical protein
MPPLEGGLVSMTGVRVVKERGGMPCYHKVVALAHAADGLDDLCFIIRDDFDAFQVLGFW